MQAQRQELDSLAPLDPSFVVIEVQDKGTGISQENIGKIFDPFFTTKGVGVGTGLGLSVSHGIIQKHGGELQLTSIVGEGTCFKIVLPVKHPQAETNSNSNSNSNQA